MIFITQKTVSTAKNTNVGFEVPTAILTQSIVGGQPSVPLKDQLSPNYTPLQSRRLNCTKNITVILSLSFLGWGETDSTWYVGHYWAYCTNPG
jgi:hypothetical protein